MRQSLYQSHVVTNSEVASSASAVTLLAAHPRLGASIFNDSTAILHVKLGAGATSTSKTREIAAGGYWEVPFGYQGIITGVWEAANGAAYVAEYT